MKRKMSFTLVVSIALVLGLLAVNNGAASSNPQPQAYGQPLVGTWVVTLQFGPCPNVPPVPVPVLHTYSSDGTMEEVSGGTVFRSDSLGSWKHLRDHQYEARHKFFIFNAAGARIFTEVVTSQIELQGRDSFTAAATFDLFAPDGITPIPGSTGCPIHIIGTRF